MQALPPQVPLLTAPQIRQFKREGFLVLPRVLDPRRCEAVCDRMWATVAEQLPRMRRDDTSTWHVTEEEGARFEKAAGDLDPYFSAGKGTGKEGGRLNLKNGTEQHLLDTVVRPMWSVAEQLVGAGTLIWPAGEDERGLTTGPCFLSDEVVEGLGTHQGKSTHGGVDISDKETAAGFDWDGNWEWEPALELPRTGPVWLNAQGSRGLYITPAGATPHEPPYPGGHSDGSVYGNMRLQMMAYLQDVPKDGGAFTVWPGSHARIWGEQWAAFAEGETHTKSRLGKSPKESAPGYGVKIGRALV